MLDMVRELLVRALHRLCGTWCALWWWTSAGHVKRGSSLPLADGGVRLDECGSSGCVLFGGDIELSRPYAECWLLDYQGREVGSISASLLLFGGRFFQ